jgi:hypothetical protein
VTDREPDGRRIGQLFAAEVRGHEDPPFARLSVVDVHDVTGSGFGAFAYGIDRDDERVADVFVHEDRTRVELRAGVDTALEAGREAGLRTRPKAVEPPRTVVFVENGAEVKRALRVLGHAVRSVGDDPDPDSSQRE